MRSRTLLAALAVLLALSGTASATVIDFDDGTDGLPVDGFYAALGVTFSNTTWTTNFGLAGTSGGLGIRATDTFFQPTVSTPLVAVFAFAVSSVSIRGIDVGERGARIDAYDSVVGGNLVAFDQDFGTGIGVGTFFDLFASGSGILRIELYQPNAISSADGMLWENLEFEADAVPEPGTLGLLGIGIAAMRIRRRRTPKA